MGVPGFFLWLVKKYKNIITYKLDDEYEVDILYLDANCLIHPQCQKALKNYSNWHDTNFIENKMLDEIEKYIDYLVLNVKPTKMLYIAVDGVAPCAKIKQQRMRRFKSIKYRDQINSLKRKHNIKLDKKWDNAAITPGTKFMQKITNRLLKVIRNPKYNHLEIIFSSGNTPGEGEHKLLQHINKLDENENNNIVIYGLDADLIFLAMASNNNNVHLLREVQHFGNNGIVQKDDKESLLDVVVKDIKLQTKNKKDDTDDNSNEAIDYENMEELNYLHIDILKNKLYTEIVSKLKINVKPKLSNIVNDFIFLSYFMGNDFLPHITSINIKTRGLDILLEAYNYTLNILNVDDETYSVKEDEKYYTKNMNHFLIIKKKKITINNIFLKTFLQYLSSKEDTYFINNYRRPPKYRQSFSNDPFEKDKFKLDNLQFHIKDPIKLGKDNSKLWKARYYKHHFDTHDENYINEICKHFLDGLLWVTKYYLDKCSSWEWYYPYNHSPMISDLSNFFEMNMNYYDTVKFKKGKPLDPFIQLLSVLHPACNYLLPTHLRYLMINNKSPIIDLYPYIFTEDLIGKGLLWKCIPILPPLDIERIKKLVIYKNIDDKDMIRNKVINIYSN